MPRRISAITESDAWLWRSSIQELKSATWISKKPFSISIIFIYGCMLAENLGVHLSINKVTSNQEHGKAEKDGTWKRVKKLYFSKIWNRCTKFRLTYTE